MNEETGRDHARRAARRVVYTVVAMTVAAMVAIVVGLFRHFQAEPGPVIEGEIDDGRLTEPTRLCTRGSDAPCRQASAVERFLAGSHLNVQASSAAGSGAQGAIALAIEDREGTRLRAKWRTESSAELTHEPINELAAHRLQAMLLDEADYVVPPAATRCFALDDYRSAIDSAAEPFEETGCVLGYLSYWLVGSKSLVEGREAGVFPTPAAGPRALGTGLFDAERFQADETYRRTFANLNLLTYLVANGDAHSGQFVYYEQPLHLFVVDSSMAFRVPENPRMLVREENLGETLLAPAIPAEVAERIRQLTPRLVQQLLVLDELRLANGTAERVAPSEPVETDAHVRRRGERIQLGLTSSEIGLLWNRVTELQRRLEDGDLGTF